MLSLKHCYFEFVHNIKYLNKWTYFSILMYFDEKYLSSLGSKVKLQLLQKSSLWGLVMKLLLMFWNSSSNYRFCMISWNTRPTSKDRLTLLQDILILLKLRSTYSLFTHMGKGYPRKFKKKLPALFLLKQIYWKVYRLPCIYYQ